MFKKVKAGLFERLQLSQLNRIYASAYGRNYYDLYLPKAYEKELPVVVWVHGGAFVAGDKSGVKNWAACLAAKGMAVAAVEYQWAPEASWPAQVCQIGECCKALFELAAEKKLDKKRVVIAGDSAGAHMAAQFSLIHSSEAFCSKAGLETVLEKDALKAALLFCGPYDIEQMANPSGWFLRLAMHRVGWSYLGRRNWRDSGEAKLANIRNYVTPGFPPTFLTDGSRASFDRQGKALAQALRRQGVAVSELFFAPEEEEAVHEYQFDMKMPLAGQCYNQVCDFLRAQQLMEERDTDGKDALL